MGINNVCASWSFWSSATLSVGKSISMVAHRVLIILSTVDYEGFRWSLKCLFNRMLKISWSPRSLLPTLTLLPFLTHLSGFLSCDLLATGSSGSGLVCMDSLVPEDWPSLVTIWPSLVLCPFILPPVPPAAEHLFSHAGHWRQRAFSISFCFGLIFPEVKQIQNPRLYLVNLAFSGKGILYPDVNDHLNKLQVSRVRNLTVYFWLMNHVPIVNHNLCFALSSMLLLFKQQRSKRGPKSWVYKDSSHFRFFGSYDFCYSSFTLLLEWDLNRQHITKHLCLCSNKALLIQIGRGLGVL